MLVMAIGSSNTNRKFRGARETRVPFALIVIVASAGFDAWNRAVPNALWLTRLKGGRRQRHLVPRFDQAQTQSIRHRTVTSRHVTQINFNGREPPVQAAPLMRETRAESRFWW